MATINSTQSSFASELLLNKLMNGQVQSSTGKTVTAAGRAISYAMSGKAYEANVAEANMINGAGLVSAAQAEVTNVKDQLDKLKKDMIAMQNTDGVTSTQIKSLGSMAKTVMSSLGTNLDAATYNGKTLFDGTAKTLNAGDGQTISVLDKAVGTGTGKLKSLLAKVGTTLKNTTALTAAVTAVDDAINEMIQYMSDYSYSLKEVQNRALILAEKGESLNAAASGQAITGVSGANGLLDNILGGNTTV